MNLSSCPPDPRTVAWTRCTAPVSAEIPFPTGPYWDRHREAQRGRVQPCGAPLRSDGSACTTRTAAGGVQGVRRMSSRKIFAPGYCALYFPVLIFNHQGGRQPSRP